MGRPPLLLLLLLPQPSTAGAAVPCCPSARAARGARCCPRLRSCAPTGALACLCARREYALPSSTYALMADQLKYNPAFKVGLLRAWSCGTAPPVPVRSACSCCPGKQRAATSGPCVCTRLLTCARAQAVEDESVRASLFAEVVAGLKAEGVEREEAAAAEHAFAMMLIGARASRGPPRGACGGMCGPWCCHAHCGPQTAAAWHPRARCRAGGPAPHHQVGVAARQATGAWGLGRAAVGRRGPLGHAAAPALLVAVCGRGPARSPVGPAGPPLWLRTQPSPARAAALRCAARCGSGLSTWRCRRRGGGRSLRRWGR